LRLLLGLLWLGLLLLRVHGVTSIPALLLLWRLPILGMLLLLLWWLLLLLLMLMRGSVARVRRLRPLWLWRRRLLLHCLMLHCLLLCRGCRRCRLRRLLLLLFLRGRRRLRRRALAGQGRGRGESRQSKGLLQRFGQELRGPIQHQPRGGTEDEARGEAGGEIVVVVVVVRGGCGQQPQLGEARRREAAGEPVFICVGWFNLISQSLSPSIHQTKTTIYPPQPPEPPFLVPRRQRRRHGRLRPHEGTPVRRDQNVGLARHGRQRLGHMPQS
jgi:hypothetical protein